MTSLPLCDGSQAQHLEGGEPSDLQALGTALARREPVARELCYEPLDSLRHHLCDREPDLGSCRGKRIGVLIVAYNAITTISGVLKRIPPDVWNNVEEIALFDDASEDNTYELAVGMKTLRLLPKLQILRHERNLGYGGNQKAGYRYFIEKGFDIVVLLHGDGQYAPEILSDLYHPIVAGEADAVFGSRMMKKYGGPLRGGMPFYKFAGNRILSAYENRSLGLQLTEFHSGYRAYNLHALRAIDFAHMTDEFHFDTEIIIKLHHQRFVFLEVPVPTYYGSEICRVNGIRYARDVHRAVARYKQTCRAVRRHPEFQEYFVHYAIKESRFSSHYFARQMTGSGRRVLDLGCGEGFFAAELTAGGSRVTGVDVLPEPTHVQVMERYFQADLNEGIGKVIGQLEGKTFDRVLLLDVLEHLVHPQRLLRECREVLSPAGAIVVSVPNIANITTRLMLLFGRFTYTDRGILDATHVRFFTRKTARELLEQNGYRIVHEKMTVMPIELALGLRAGNPLIKVLNRALSLITRALPGLFGYQAMFLARAERRPK
jgi:2-polyprenyl-3-methyl-5-hydroxy-6-metoxy-1,4-benzoquinol methylase